MNEEIKSMAQIVTLILSSVLALAVVITLTCGLLFAKPTGRYYMDDVKGATAVCEEIKFGIDRTMFVGSPDRAFQIYMRLSKPSVIIPKPDGVEASW